MDKTCGCATLEDDENQVLHRIAGLLEETLKWIKVTSIPHVKELLLNLLAGERRRMAYQASDGRDLRSVAGLAGVGPSTVARWWKVWMRAGIADPRSVRGGSRAVRTFSLSDFGIQVPDVEEPPERDGDPDSSADVDLD